MDLAEKRKQLEALRAARQAKQQVVEQYMASRSANSSVAASSLQTSFANVAVSPTFAPHSLAASTTTTAASYADPTARSPVPSAKSSPATFTETSSPNAPRVSAVTSAGGSVPLISPSASPAEQGKTTPRARPSAAAALPIRQRPPTPPAKAPASLLEMRKLPATSAPLIEVLAVGTPDTAAAAVARRDMPSPAAMLNHRSTVPAAAPRAQKATSPSARPDSRGGWSSLQYCMRGGTSARDMTSEKPTHPVCIFNPAVVLGDFMGSSDSGGRRVILDATACLVPYEGAAALLSDDEGDSTVWSVCVAATYGAKSVNGGGGGGSGGGGASGAGDFGTGSATRRGSLESGNVGVGASGGASNGGGGSSGGSRSAEAALCGVRASMECGYSWGSAAAAQAAVPGTTMDTALRVARESPGLVLAWLVVPLPANTTPHKEGTLYAEAATHTASTSAATTADYVVVVVPLVCDSEVTTLLAHPFQPSTLLGGTRCGRVVQWSVGQAWAQVAPRRLIERALATTGTATTLLLPPQRPTHSSFPSPQAHQAPVLRLAIHGDASCHHLYSISQEGKVCTWPAWQPLHPTASCLSFLGIRPMGNIGVAAQFVKRPGTDAMTQVFIGTTSGALLVGANRDAKSIELQYYGPPRALPTSTTVIKTLDVTACPPTATATAAAAAAAATAPLSGPAELGSLVGQSSSAESSIGLGARNPTAPPAGFDNSAAAESRSNTPITPAATATRRAAQSSTSSPMLHHGRIVSMSLQTTTHDFRGQDCVVSAASDGTCVAWFPRSAIPLEGFFSAVTSVCWSPTKPGVLAAGDSSGLVTVWAVNTSIITPVVTVSLREASRRTRGSATSDAVLWVVSGASDAAGLGGGGGGNFFADDSSEEYDVADDGDTGTSLGQSDAVGAAISSVFFSQDGRWLFASTACGYVYSMRVGASLV